MRHLHFTQSLEPLQGGGLGSSAVSLHRQMLADGVPSVLCATHGGEPQRLVDKSFEFQRIKPDVIYFSPAMQRAAPGLVREADVIHGHGLYVGTNYIFGRESTRQDTPLVYHVHGMFEPYILSRSRWKNRLVHWLFEDANFRRVRLWRALTAKEADQIRAYGIKQPVVVVPNGLNLADFPKPKDTQAPITLASGQSLAKTVPRILFLGRIHPKKGLDILLSAWAKLSTLTKNWQLVIAGPDEKGHLAQIQALANSLGLRDQIVFTGPVTGETKIRLLYSSDLFVLSSYSEGFSMSLLEALACGIPVIATHACNFPEISQNQAGWECDSALDSLIATLRVALQTPESVRREIGLNGRRLVESRYSWSAVVQTLQTACTAYCS
jgi:glycosyltransferase involved in cell wall biosynthesis